jgi:hypothetical protein
MLQGAAARDHAPPIANARSSAIGTGVVRLRLHREADISSVSDLLVYSLDELEAVAQAKGGIRRLLDEKWTRVYKASSPRDLFTRSELQRAA